MRRILLLLATLLFISPLFGQNNGDIKRAYKLEKQAYDDFAAGHFESSIEKLLSAASIYKSLNLVEEYTNKLQEIAACFSYLEDIENEIHYFELAEQEIVSYYGNGSNEHIDILYTLVDEYVQGNQRDKAIKSIDLLDSFLSNQPSEDTANYMVFLETAAKSLRDSHCISEAIRYYSKLLEEVNKNYGQQSEVKSQILLELAKVFMDSGNPLASVKYVREAKAILDDIGKPGLRYANCLGDLAYCESVLGDYKNTLHYYNTALKIYADSLGIQSESYISTYGNIAQTYFEIGNYKKGVAMAEEVVSLSKGNEDLYSTALTNLAYDYSELGIYDKAIELDSLAIAIEEKNMLPQLDSLGKHRENYALLLNNIAYNFGQLKDPQKAIDLTLQSIEIYKELYGESYPLMATSYNNLASLYDALGENDKAISYANKSLFLLSDTEGNRSANYAAAVSNLAGYYVNSGNYNSAKELYEESLRILSFIVGDDHPDYLQTMTNLSLCYYDERNYGKCQEILAFVSDKLRHLLRDNFIWMTSNERKDLWNKYSFAFLEELPAIVNKTGQGFEQLYDAILLSKGIILNTEINLERIIKQSKNPQLSSIYDSLLAHRAELLEISQLGDQVDYNLRDSLERITSTEERQLVSLSTEFGDFTEDLIITWKDIKDQLGKNDYAIEFVDYRNDSDTTFYSALILGKNYEVPRMVYIGTEGDINRLSKYATNTYAASQLYNLIWGSIEKIVPKNANIYFSPSGELHQISIEYLSDDNGKSISERYSLNRVSSTRNLCKEPRQYAANAALFGNLDYDLDTTLMANNSLEYHDGNYLANRGYNNLTDNVASKWNNLENTKAEVEDIARALEVKNYKTVLFENEKGTEESFKSLSGQEYAIIHLATHGFFLKESAAKKELYFSPNTSRNILNNPMRRSGILFSGANHSWLGRPIPDYSEDGVLLAEEIATLDLHGTDLLILSACETGLGEISSEGVAGLQYGFKQAGVNTIVMSLWKVDDEATRILMTEFYRNLLTGKSKHQSFEKARESLKSDSRYTNPYYWAAFIMLD